MPWKKKAKSKDRQEWEGKRCESRRKIDERIRAGFPGEVALELRLKGQGEPAKLDQRRPLSKTEFALLMGSQEVGKDVGTRSCRPSYFSALRRD